MVELLRGNSITFFAADGEKDSVMRDVTNDVLFMTKQFLCSEFRFRASIKQSVETNTTTPCFRSFAKTVIATVIEMPTRAAG
jgi:hypothetical protein